MNIKKLILKGFACINLIFGHGLMGMDAGSTGSSATISTPASIAAIAVSTSADQKEALLQELKNTVQSSNSLYDALKKIRNLEQINAGTFNVTTRELQEIIQTKFPNLNQPDSSGNNALQLAAQNGDLSIITFLIRAGADLNKLRTSDSLTPLLIAIENNHLSAVQKLISAGALLNAPFSMDALEFADLKGSDEIKNFLSQIIIIMSIIQSSKSKPQALDTIKKLPLTQLARETGNELLNRKFPALLTAITQPTTQQIQSPQEQNINSLLEGLIREFQSSPELNKIVSDYKNQGIELVLDKYIQPLWVKHVASFPVLGRVLSFETVKPFLRGMLENFFGKGTTAGFKAITSAIPSYSIKEKIKEEFDQVIDSHSKNQLIGIIITQPGQTIFRKNDDLFLNYMKFLNEYASSASGPYQGRSVRSINPALRLKRIEIESAQDLLSVLTFIKDQYPQDTSTKFVLFVQPGGNSSIINEMTRMNVNRVEIDTLIYLNVSGAENQPNNFRRLYNFYSKNPETLGKVFQKRIGEPPQKIPQQFEKIDNQFVFPVRNIDTITLKSNSLVRFDSNDFTSGAFICQLAQVLEETEKYKLNFDFFAYINLGGAIIPGKRCPEPRTKSPMIFLKTFGSYEKGIYLLDKVSRVKTEIPIPMEKPLMDNFKSDWNLSSSILDQFKKEIPSQKWSSLKSDFATIDRRYQEAKKSIMYTSSEITEDWQLISDTPTQPTPADSNGDDNDWTIIPSPSEIEIEQQP